MTTLAAQLAEGHERTFLFIDSRFVIPHLVPLRAPGIHLVGEILDVDGRIGGFNFQWAWSCAAAAAEALAGG